MLFEGKVAIVTGAAQGIGLAVAESLVAQGARVAMADIRADDVAERAAALDPSGFAAFGIGYDASLPEEADKLVRETHDRFGGVDLVVPSAGIYPFEPFSTVNDESWDRMISVNLSGVARLCMRALAAVRDDGSLVLIASAAAHRGGEIGSAHYGATKGGLVSLGRGLAREFAPKIRVNIVSPGLIETPMTRRLIDERGDKFVKETPMKRYGTAKDVANAVTFLLSDQSSFITGQVLHVNGGSYIGG